MKRSLALMIVFALSAQTAAYADTAPLSCRSRYLMVKGLLTISSSKLHGSRSFKWKMRIIDPLQGR